MIIELTAPQTEWLRGFLEIEARDAEAGGYDHAPPVREVLAELDDAEAEQEAR